MKYTFSIQVKSFFGKFLNFNSDALKLCTNFNIL